MSDTEAEVAPAPEDDVRMTIWDHLRELRTRLLYAAIGVLVCTIVAWVFRVEILAWLIRPYEAAWRARDLPGNPELQTLSPADVFVGYLQLSLTAGIIAAAPIIFYQLWAFVSPGLYKREKRLIVPFVFFSSILFLGGVAFAYYVAFPFTFSYFFSTRMLLAFGAVFELPLLISFLVIGGIVTPRQLLRFSRWAVVLSVAAGAIVTPGPEISSQLAVAGALIGLYFLSLGIAYVLRPKKRDDDDEKQLDDGGKNPAIGKRPD